MRTRSPPGQRNPNNINHLATLSAVLVRVLARTRRGDFDENPNDSEDLREYTYTGQSYHLTYYEGSLILPSISRSQKKSNLLQRNLTMATYIVACLFTIFWGAAFWAAARGY